MTTLKSNDNQWLKDANGRICLPLPPEKINMRGEMEIYARFMRHLRLVPNSSVEIKILSAIQFTADLLNHHDAYIAKILVDLGLRAPRKSFPADYLEFVDKTNLRSNLEVGSASRETKLLCQHWHDIGEDKLAAIRYIPAYAENSYFIER